MADLLPERNDITSLEPVVARRRCAPAIATPTSLQYGLQTRRAGETSGGRTGGDGRLIAQR
jgi:hypothetical protein